MDLSLGILALSEKAKAIALLAPWAFLGIFLFMLIIMIWVEWRRKTNG